MTGPEHYREAELLLAYSKNHTDQGNEGDDRIAQHAAAQALVHATLALAAAQAPVINHHATYAKAIEVGQEWVAVVSS